MCDNCAEARRVANEVADQLSNADRRREFYRRQGECREQERIIKLLTDLNVIRRCSATGKLVAFDTNGKNVLYLTGLEKISE